MARNRSLRRKQPSFASIRAPAAACEMPAKPQTTHFVNKKHFLPSIHHTFAGSSIRLTSFASARTRRACVDPGQATWWHPRLWGVSIFRAVSKRAVSKAELVRKLARRKMIADRKSLGRKPILSRTGGSGTEAGKFTPRALSGNPAASAARSLRSPAAGL